jgi:hypothetical protein
MNPSPSLCQRNDVSIGNDSDPLPREIGPLQTFEGRSAAVAMRSAQKSAHHLLD